MKFIDFFAGVGGFRRGMELAGHECVGFCEFDKFAVASYTSMHLITDEQRQYLATLPIKKRQKEILKDEYRNGEWYANDITTVDARNLPEADCWCAGFPCQDISVAGKQLGFDGNRSSLYFQIIRLVKESAEESRPEWLFFENVKNLLSINKGWDFARVLFALDEVGYDAEWGVLNSKDFNVPQNRERIFIIGHSRKCGRREVFPVEGANGENRISIIGHRDGYRRNMQIYSSDGITEALDTAQGGNREFHVPVIIPEQTFCDLQVGGGIELMDKANCIKARYEAGVTNFKHDNSGVAIPIMASRKNGIKETEVGGCLMARDYKGIGNQDMTAVAIPVLTPDRANKRQNGRRFKENGEPMFTLTGQDRHGVGVNVSGKEVVGLTDTSHSLNANDQRKVFGAKQERTMCGEVIEPCGILRNVRSEYGKEIRKDYETGNLDISRHEFLEKEIREDGVANTLSTVQKDNYVAERVSPELVGGIGEKDFGKQYRQGNRVYDSESIAMALNSQPVGNAGGNSYLYSVKVKEATKQGYAECRVGGDSVNLAMPNSKTRRGRVGEGVANTLDTSCNQGIFVKVSDELTVYAVWYEKYKCYIAIRKLTPKECFRLQAFSDEMFERAEFVNSNSQLYKQAGNSVTVSVIKAIAERF